jgi:hypothetical protein
MNNYNQNDIEKDYDLNDIQNNEYDSNDIENIDLAYTYTENFLKERRNESSNLKSRQATFLGFAGLLLRFSIDLPTSQPAYLLTKILALVTSCFSIAILACALTASLGGKVVYPSSLIDDNELFLLKNANVKFYICRKHTKLSEDIFSSVKEQKNLLNWAIGFLVASAICFTINGVLVSCLGK